MFGVTADELAPSIYREFHKALRHALCSTLTTVGAATAHPSSLADVNAAWRDLLALISTRERLDATLCGPVIARHAPTTVARLDADCIAISRAMEALGRSADRLIDAQPEDQWCVLEQFYLELADLVALYMPHLRFKENDVMRELNSSMSGAELSSLRNDLGRSITGDEMNLLLRSMMPALNTAERVDTLEGLRSGSDPETFEVYRSIAESVLSVSDYRAVVDAIGIG